MNQSRSGNIPVVIYIRTATHTVESDTFNYPAPQEARCLGAIARFEVDGWFIKSVISDLGWSGANLKRPGSRALVEMVTAGSARIVMVSEINRIARHTGPSRRALGFFHEHICLILKRS